MYNLYIICVIAPLLILDYYVGVFCYSRPCQLHRCICGWTYIYTFENLYPNIQNNDAFDNIIDIISFYFPV